ncbi:hypothetical protein CPB86DRAFT_878720 [Serendipita vermifera]|nr:hypothetical protein CPB86DRAFT_878720 [Serendipita vermifera]
MEPTLSHPYGIGLTEENASKVANLQQLAQRVQQLEILLKQTKEAYNLQFKDLQHLRASPINQLPTELLSKIFFIACEGGQNHRIMAKVPLVCHRWRDILNNTAHLWTQIKVKITNDVTLSRRQFQCAELFIERSKPLKLSVEIDLSLVTSFQEGVEDLINRTYNFPAPSARSLSHRSLTTSRGYDDAFLQLYVEMFPVLVGKNGQNTARWKSLSIICPQYGSTKWPPSWIYPIIKKIMNFDMSLLLELSIIGDFKRMKERSEGGQHEPPLGFNFPTITSLELPAGYPITQFSVSDTKILKLQIGDLLTYQNVVQLGRFHALRSLTYISESVWLHNEVSLSPVYLPVLDELVLVGDPEPMILSLFDTPKLETLQLCFNAYTYRRQDHTQYKTYSQASVVCIDTPGDPEVPFVFEGFFNNLLPQIISAVHIYISKDVESILLASIKRIKGEESDLLPSLEAVYRWNADDAPLIYEAHQEQAVSLDARNN